MKLNENTLKLFYKNIKSYEILFQQNYIYRNLNDG